jgi:hypothetical protein
MKNLLNLITWHLWRRWQIYCPDKPIQPHKADFQTSLLDYDESYISPCSFNEINCGRVDRAEIQYRIPGMDLKD